jgi:PAS domain S-box-containing protein
LTGTGERVAVTGLPTTDQLAGAWTRAIAKTSHVSMSRRALHAHLLVLAGRLLDAVAAEKFDPTGPAGVGAALVAAHFTEVAALQRTVTVLGDQLAVIAARPDGAGRLTDVSGALAAGFAQALRDRTLAEQERISAAVFADSVIGIGVGDIDGTILEVNRALCEMLGFTAEEFRAHPIWEFIHATYSAPTATVYHNQLYVFVRGTDNRIYRNIDTAGSWTGWSEVPGAGATYSAPTADVYRNQLYVFVRGTDNRIYLNVLRP